MPGGYVVRSAFADSAGAAGAAGATEPVLYGVHTHFADSAMAKSNSINMEVNAQQIGLRGPFQPSAVSH